MPHVLPAGALSRLPQPVLPAAGGFHRLELQHSTRDPASCRVVENSGFALKGTRLRSLLHDDGRHDMHLHGRVAQA